MSVLKPLKLKPQVVSEAKEQEWLFRWRQWAMRQYPELRWLHAIPNGLAASSIGAAARMKRQGMTKGIPDICLPVARRGCHGLYIELKRSNGGKASPEQAACIQFLNEQGYRAEICHGWRAAVEVIEWYLREPTR